MYKINHLLSTMPTKVKKEKGLHLAGFVGSLVSFILYHPKGTVNPISELLKAKVHFDCENQEKRQLGKDYVKRVVLLVRFE